MATKLALALVVVSFFFAAALADIPAWGFPSVFDHRFNPEPEKENGVFNLDEDNARPPVQAARKRRELAVVDANDCANIIHSFLNFFAKVAPVAYRRKRAAVLDFCASKNSFVPA